MKLTDQQRFHAAGDPVSYCKYFLNEFVTVEHALNPEISIDHANAPVRQQRQIMRSVARNKRTSVAGANMWGKSHMLARIASWWIDRHDECLVVVTAPKFSTITMNFMIPFNKLRGSVEIPTGKSTLRTYMPDISRPERQIMAVTANKPENFAGWHYWKNKLFLFDEASGIHNQIWDAARPMLGRDDSKILVVGNPLREEGEENYERFPQTATSGLWNFYNLNAWYHPNVVHGKQLIPGSMSPNYPQEMLEEYGPDDPQYIARVLGQFATALSSSMFALYLEKVMDRDSDFKRHHDGVLGVDPAGKRTGDKTSVSRWGWDTTSHNAEIIFASESATPTQTADFVQTEFREKRARAVGVDTNGIGYMLPDLLLDRGISKKEIYEYVGHKRANRRRIYESKYDEDAFILRGMMEESVIGYESTSKFQLKYNPELNLQLDTRRFTSKRDGRLALMDKYTATKSSPDEFDSLLVGMDAYRRFRHSLMTIPGQTTSQGVIPIPDSSFIPVGHHMPGMM